MKTDELEFAKNIVETLQNAAKVIDQIARGDVNPEAIELARHSMKDVVCPALDHVLGYVAGMKGGVQEGDPNGMIGLIQEELSEAIEEIQSIGKLRKTQDSYLN